VSPVRLELGFYIPEDDILHSDHRETSRLTMVLCVLGNAAFCSAKTPNDYE
jgi:hypothetical protein